MTKIDSELFRQEAVALGAEALDAFNATVEDASQRGRELFETGLQTWSAETKRFQDDMWAQCAATLDQLRVCKSPLDVLGVEQAWLAARSKAYVDAGLRFAQAFASVAQGLGADAPPPAKA